MIRIKLELKPEEKNGAFQYPPLGYIFRAILMKWLTELKPDLVQELHSSNKIRPYSIQIMCRREKLIFYINIFNPSLSSLLINDLIQKKQKSFKIMKQKYLVRKALFEDISINSYLRKGRPVSSFKIDFLKPTFFNTTRGDYSIKLPIPEIMFSNLVNLWNEFSDEKDKIEKNNFLQWVNRYMYPSSFKIKTQAREMGENLPASGVIGWMIYFLTENHLIYNKYIDGLCKLGELTNVGGGRTAGFGLIKYTPLEFFESSTN